MRKFNQLRATIDHQLNAIYDEVDIDLEHDNINEPRSKPQVRNTPNGTPHPHSGNEERCHGGSC